MTEKLKRPIGVAELVQTMQGMLVIASKGISVDTFQRYSLGVDPDALLQIARESADEEFTELPDMPEGTETGRLKKIGLLEPEVDVVKQALVDTFELAFMTGMVLGMAAGVPKGVDDGDEGS